MQSFKNVAKICLTPPWTPPKNVWPPLDGVKKNVDPHYIFFVKQQINSNSVDVQVKFWGKISFYYLYYANFMWFDKYVWKNKFKHIYYKRQNGWSLVLHQDINIYQDCMITITIPKWLVIQMTPKQEEKALCFNKIWLSSNL